MATDPRSSDVPPSIDPDTKGLPNGFPTQAALAATLIAAFPGFTDQGPPPKPTPPPIVQYHREYQLIDWTKATASSPATYTVLESLVGTDGSRRNLFTVTSNVNAAGIDWLCDMLFGVQPEQVSGPSQTPQQKKKQLEQEAVEVCCDGVYTVPPCDKFCFSSIYVGTDDDGNVTVTSIFVVCDEGDGCPDIAY